MSASPQELFDQSTAPEAAVEVPVEARAAMLAQMAERYPDIVTIATSTLHDEETVVGHGCDDEFEFRFALDLMLDGIERLYEQNWNSADAKLMLR